MLYRFKRLAAVIASCILVLSLSGCMNMQDGFSLGSLLSGEDTSSAAQPEDFHVQRVVALRKEARGSPNSARAQNDLKRAEEEASTHYLTAGMQALNGRRYEDALRLFELGLLAQPTNAALNEARMQTLRRREVGRLYADAQQARTVGNLELTQSLLEKANSLDRSNPKVEAALQEVKTQASDQQKRYVVKALDSDERIDLNFRSASLKDALDVISKHHNINYVFDPDVEASEVNISAKKVTFGQAFNLLLQSSNTFYKVIGPNSVLIAPNDSDKKEQYADLFIKTFHLRTMKAEQMEKILTSSLDLKKITSNTALNTIQVRGTRETLKVVERVVAANDRSPAEIMLDVEILEINRSKSEQLGIDYGSQISASVPQFTVTDALDNISSKVFGGGLVTVPTLTLRYFKNDVDARILAKPRIRTLDGEQAKIHVGDRVPLRSATIQDATGQTRTTFEYRDIGIRLEVLPKYHLDGTISVAMKLEVSSLGQNLGTINEPAFSIGTRNVDTTMLLREGETAVLGGLIRDEERRRLNKVPGLGDIGGVVGRLFAVNDDEDSRTDILLTITPHVLRRQELPRMGDTDFYSGHKGILTTKDNFDYLKKHTPKDEMPRIRLSPRGDLQEAKVRNIRKPNQAGASERPLKQPNDASPVAMGTAGETSPQIDFSAERYSVEEGGAVKIEVRGRNLGATRDIATRILFNPDKLTLDTASSAKSVGKVQADSNQPGVVNLTVKNVPPNANDGELVLATLALRGKAKGLSYLLLNSTATPKGENGQAVNVEFGASKVEIR